MIESLRMISHAYRSTSSIMHAIIKRVDGGLRGLSGRTHPRVEKNS
jgi:hypothetical protein